MSAERGLFTRRAGSGGLGLAFGALTLLACVAAAAAALADTAVSARAQALRGRLTVALESAATPDQAATLAEAIRALPGVSAARLLDEQALQNALRPWIGNADRLPPELLPRMIDVELTPGGAPRGRDAVAAIRALLRTRNLEAIVDDHRAFSNDALAALRFVRLTAAAAAAVVVATAGAIAFFAGAAAMAANAGTVSLLERLGASRRFIAREALRGYVRAAAPSILGGVLLAAGLVATAAWSARRSEVAIFAQTRLDDPILWIAMLIAAFALAAAAVAGARSAVFRARA